MLQGKNLKSFWFLIKEELKFTDQCKQVKRHCLGVEDAKKKAKELSQQYGGLMVRVSSSKGTNNTGFYVC